MNNRYNTAHTLYMKSNYPRTREHYDAFLNLHPVGALSTRAELERSDCYYQLGFKAYNKENWLLASRLLYLGNSGIADELLDECYKNLAIVSLANQDTSKTLNYYGYIIDYLTDSELIPEMLYNRINIHLAQNENLTAFHDYHNLWMLFPDSEFRTSIQPKIDVLIPDFLQEAINMKENGEYDNALDICFRLSQYPSRQQSDIINEIGDLYRLKAESDINQNLLTSARKNYDLIYENCPDREKSVLARIEEICQGFISIGDTLELNLKFDSAINTYSKCFKLVKDHPIAVSEIASARETKARFLEAMVSLREGEEKERIKEHKQALDLYLRTDKLFSTSEAKNKIFIMQNILLAEKDPKGFARSIVDDYNNGLLLRNVAYVEDFMNQRYGEDVVKPSGWKVTYSIGLYKYEVRYDLISTFGNYYFAWRVDLKTRHVAPSNKISETLVTDIDQVLEEME